MRYNPSLHGGCENNIRFYAQYNKNFMRPFRAGRGTIFSHAIFFYKLTPFDKILYVWG
jgi:hypothetical protein